LAHEERGDRSAEVVHSPAGYQVYDQHYEKIGKVDDLFVNERDQPEYIGMKTGLLGTKSVLIPMELVRVNDRRQLVEVATDKDVVTEGPTFGDDRDITSEFTRRVLDYYREGTTQPERRVQDAGTPDAAGDERVDLRPGERVEAQRAETLGRSGERVTGPTTGGADRERGGDLGGEDELRVQRSEEELRASVRERETGGVNVRKRVRTDREEVRVPKKREEAQVERVPAEERGVSETGERGASGVDIGEDEIRVPIIEEEIVVEKRPVVKEEIRIRKNVVEEEEVVETDVRKEEVDIDDQTTRRDR
jgi:uncharacterized protein (TIGR02271 family)